MRLITILASLMMVFSSFTQAGDNEAPQFYRTFDNTLIPILQVHQVHESLSADQDRYVMLDVRTIPEFLSNHIKGALNVPHTEIGQQINRLEKYKNLDVVVFCRSGARARIAVDALHEAGFTKLHLMHGDMREWHRQQLPLVKKKLD